jgi:hypothetical protein
MGCGIGVEIFGFWGIPLLLKNSKFILTSFRKNENKSGRSQ